MATLFVWANALSSHAQTLTGASTFTNGTWSNPANWALAPPVAGANITLNNGATMTINDNFTCGNITLNGGINNTTVIINNGFTLNAQGIIINAPTLNNRNNRLT